MAGLRAAKQFLEPNVMPAENGELARAKGQCASLS
jgi:hypothetical protein